MAPSWLSTWCWWEYCSVRKVAREGQHNGFGANELAKVMPARDHPAHVREVAQFVPAHVVQGDDQDVRRASWAGATSAAAELPDGTRAVVDQPLPAREQHGQQQRRHGCDQPAGPHNSVDATGASKVAGAAYECCEVVEK